MKLTTILLVLILIGCTYTPKSSEINEVVGVYGLNPKYTETELYEEVKSDNILLHVNRDFTFVIRSKRKHCFTDVKGKWTIKKDFEGNYCIFELLGVKRTTRGREVLVKCDSINGLLNFRIR